MSLIELKTYRIFPVILLVFLLNTPVKSLDNGLAKTPPMGWISWVRFTCDTNCTGNNRLNCISYELYSRMAKSMNQKGFVDLGYQYVNIDDCWSEMERDQQTKSLVPHKQRFYGSNGIKQLALELRNMGVKLGIYGDCGTKTCASYPAQLSKYDSAEGNYYEVDAKTLYSWGVESFKFDNCNISPNRSEEICPGMSEALQRGRNEKNKPILLTCEWPFYMLRNNGNNTPTPVNWELAKKSCNIWRYNDDVLDSWESVVSIIDFTIGMQEIILAHHGPGGWFDPDQLIVGGFGLSHNQARAHMAIWSLWSAPLFMSNDIEKLTNQELELLQNRELIAVNQDPLGIWAQMVIEKKYQFSNPEKLQVFVKAVKSQKPNDLVGSELFCPDFVIGYLYHGTLGNSVTFSLPIRTILMASKSVIEEASKRLGHPEWYGKCMERINPTRNDTNTKPIRSLLVKDLMDTLEVSEKMITDTLDLEVNPTGIRVVRLTEQLF